MSSFIHGNFHYFQAKGIAQNCSEWTDQPWSGECGGGKFSFEQHWPPRRSSISHQAARWHLQIIFFNYFAALSSKCQHFLSSLLEDASWPHSQSHHRGMCRKFSDSTPALLWKCHFHLTSQTTSTSDLDNFFNFFFLTQVWPFPSTRSKLSSTPSIL